MYSFLLVFVGTYVSMYILFALFYMSQPSHCVSNVQKFSHALWFSLHTAATIGYGHQAPDPECIILNLAIMAQVLTAAILQAALLGLVYARFSAPGSRAATIKFSTILACYRGSDGHRRLAFRVANLRRHQVLRPEVHMLLLRKEHVGGVDGPLEYRYHELPLTHVSGQGRLWLGVPSIMAHTIDENSFLWGVTRQELEESEAEIVVLLDGTDETTSTAMQARYSYFPADIQWDHRFAGVLERQKNGVLAADYSHFDLTRLAQEDGDGDESETVGVRGSQTEREPPPATKSIYKGTGGAQHQRPDFSSASEGEASAQLDKKSAQSAGPRVKFGAL